MKTIALHRLHNTYRQDRHGKALTIGALTELPEANHLTPEEREVFSFVGEKLIEGRALTAADLILLEAYSVQVCLMRKAKNELETGGYVVKYTNKAGAVNEVPSAWLLIHRNATDQVSRLGTQLGLSPFSRNKIKIEDQNFDEPKSLLR